MKSSPKAQWILPLHGLLGAPHQADATPSCEDLMALRRLSGGKALNLARAAAQGHLVPRGFVITTRAYCAALEEMLEGSDLNDARSALLERPLPLGLVEEIAQALGELGGDGEMGGWGDGGRLKRAQHAHASPDLCQPAEGELISKQPDPHRADGAPLPQGEVVVASQPDLAQEISVAVRSSASDEDGNERSFAGQQMSVLSVRGLDALLDAVRQVWASLFSPESLLYRGRARLDGLPPAMAVLVQVMVPAQSAGVLFTSNPLEAGDDEMLISSTFGIGAAVVDGDNADTFTLSRRDGAVHAELAQKRHRLVIDTKESGLGEESLSERDGANASLSADDLLALRDKGRSLESFFGRPQDIEFAFAPDAGGQRQLFLLQARPITTKRGQLSSTGHAAALYSNANVGEALPGVGSPFTWSIISAFTRRGFETAFGALGLEVSPDYGLVSSFRGRVYLNISEFVTIASQIPLMKGETLARLAGVLDSRGLEGTYQHSSPASFLLRLPLTLPKLGLSQLAMPLKAKRWSKRFRRARDRFFDQDLRLLSRVQLLSELDFVDDVFNKTGEVMLASASNFLMSYVVVSEALKRLGGRDAATKEATLFSGLTGVESAAPGLELLTLARLVRESESLRARFDAYGPGEDLAPLMKKLSKVPEGRRFLRKLEQYLDRWGHRAAREAEIATPRWREDPSFLMRVLKRHLGAPSLPSAQEIERDQAALREATTQLIRRHFFTGTGVFFRVLLRWSQHNTKLREELRAYVVDTLSMYRHFLLEIGRRMVEDRRLDHRDQVFYLTYAEVRAWLQGARQGIRSRVAYRSAQMKAFEESPDPPDTFLLVQDQVLSQHDLDAPELRHEADVLEALQGLPGAPGCVEGRARVLRSLSSNEVKLERGEILVASATDVGWTPLFLVAGGVVTDRGGPLSHSCVVAREYGIPAVAGVGNATQRIQTGDLVRMDGLAGRVEVLERG